MQNSDMQGPCSGKCWRWKVYGGLGKLLIRITTLANNSPSSGMSAKVAAGPLKPLFFKSLRAFAWLFHSSKMPWRTADRLH